MVNKVTLLSVLVSLSTLAAGCFNRPTYQSDTVQLSNYGLQAGQPALVTFSAVWCHPCREEIDSLNDAQKEFAGQIQIKGFLLEGEAKGSPIQKEEVAKFVSYHGNPPQYPVTVDPRWRLFDQSRKPQGHSLPTLMLIDRRGVVRAVIQRSLDYKTQLRPLLVALAGGGEIPSEQNPTRPVPPPVNRGTQSLTALIGEWIARPEVAAKPNLEKNVRAAYEKAVEDNGFPRDDIPFENGKMSFLYDGADGNVPVSATWHEVTPESICEMSLTFHEDGSLASAGGSCRPR